jgi:hypothetical protein
MNYRQKWKRIVRTFVCCVKNSNQIRDRVVIYASPSTVITPTPEMQSSLERHAIPLGGVTRTTCFRCSVVIFRISIKRSLYVIIGLVDFLRITQNGRFVKPRMIRTSYHYRSSSSKMGQRNPPIIPKGMANRITPTGPR